MSNMDQYGYTGSSGRRFLTPLIVVSVLLILAAGFGIWAFMGYQDYKDNSDQKAAVAAEEAKAATQAEEAAKYAEESKSPLKTFTGPSDYGSVTFQYPKTWSGYVLEDSTAGNGQPLDGYFHPDIVPDINQPASVFALRVAIVNEPYDQALEAFTDGVEDGSVTVAPYKLAKVEGVVGSLITGTIDQDTKGSMALFPLRNVTLKVWTETDQYINDFNTIILPNLSFSP